MPDITMCKGDTCPLKEKCERYLAQPSRRQAFFLSPPYKHEDPGGGCDFFAPTLTGEEATKKQR